MSFAPRFVFFACLVVLSACSEGTESDGDQVYRQPLEGGNSFTCETCHALEEPAADGIRRPGHPIGNAASRPSYKNGQLTSLRDAVNTCVTEWMRAPAFGADDASWLALETFLADLAPASAPAIVSLPVPPPADLTGGDAARGRTLFDQSCVVCHGVDAVGTNKGPPLVGGSTLSADYIARRVRSSGDVDSPTYPGLTGGVMPFWSRSRLSDAELLDLVAYVNMRSQDVVMPVDAGVATDAGAMDTGPSGCGMTHPRVGQTATLSMLFHNVSGTARIIDDCTFEIENFTFDGQGIDVRIYGGLGGDYDNGFAIGDDLRRAGGYQGETVRFTLPPNRSFDDLDGISVWCVDVSVSFGDGQFQ